MKRMLSLMLVILMLAGSLGVHAETGLPGCNAADEAYFHEHLYPVFEDYTALREAFVTEGNFGQAGGELIGLRAQFTTLLEDSPACLDGFALELGMSMADMQTGILFLILSIEVDDPALSERFQQIGLYYGAQSDDQYSAAAEIIAGWSVKSLGIEGDPGTDGV